MSRSAAARQPRFDTAPREIALRLRPTEEKLLRILDENRGRAVSYDQLVDRCRSGEQGQRPLSHGALKVHVSHLRAKLRQAGAEVEIGTIHGTAFQLDVLGESFAWRAEAAPVAAVEPHPETPASDHMQARVAGWKARIEAGASYRLVAAEAGVSASTVLRAIRRLEEGRLGVRQRRVSAWSPPPPARPAVAWNVNLHRKRLDDLAEPWLDSKALSPRVAERDRRTAALLRTGFSVTETAWILGLERVEIWRACDRLGVTEEVRAMNSQLRGVKPAGGLKVDHDLLDRLMQAIPDQRSFEAMVADMKPLDAVEHLLFVLSEILWNDDRMTLTPHRDLTLTASEARVLHMLWNKRGKPVSRSAMMTALYAADLDDAPSPKVIDSFICHIRAKLAPSALPIEIRNEWGTGYSLHCPDQTLLNWTR